MVFGYVVSLLWVDGLWFGIASQDGLWYILVDNRVLGFVIVLCLGWG